MVGIKICPICFTITRKHSRNCRWDKQRRHQAQLEEQERARRVPPRNNQVRPARAALTSGRRGDPPPPRQGGRTQRAPPADRSRNNNNVTQAAARAPVPPRNTPPVATNIRPTTTASPGHLIECVCCMQEDSEHWSYCGGNLRHPHCLRCVNAIVAGNLERNEFLHACADCEATINIQTLPPALLQRHNALEAKARHQANPAVHPCPNGLCVHAHNIQANAGQAFPVCQDGHAICWTCKDGATPQTQGYRCNNEQCATRTTPATVQPATAPRTSRQLTDPQRIELIKTKMREAFTGFKCANASCTIVLFKVDEGQESDAAAGEHEHGCNSLACHCGTHTCFVCHKMIEGAHFSSGFCHNLLGLGPDSRARTQDVREFQARLVLEAMGPRSGLRSSIWRAVKVWDITAPSRSRSRRNFNEDNVRWLLARYSAKGQNWFSSDGHWRPEHLAHTEQARPELEQTGAQHPFAAEHYNMNDFRPASPAFNTGQQTNGYQTPPYNVAHTDYGIEMPHTDYGNAHRYTTPQDGQVHQYRDLRRSSPDIYNGRNNGFQTPPYEYHNRTPPYEYHNAYQGDGYVTPERARTPPFYQQHHTGTHEHEMIGAFHNFGLENQHHDQGRYEHYDVPRTPHTVDLDPIHIQEQDDHHMQPNYGHSGQFHTNYDTDVNRVNRHFGYFHQSDLTFVADHGSGWIEYKDFQNNNYYYHARDYMRGFYDIEGQFHQGCVSASNF